MKQQSILILLFLMVSGTMILNAQDPRERFYYYPVLNPKHAEKPPVEGFATERVSENLDRGIIAQRMEDGSVYLGWRLLQTDPEGIAFHVYRKNKGKTKKLTGKALSQTTDFIDRTAGDDTGEYWLVPEVNGKKLEASESIQSSLNDSIPSLYATIPFQGEYRPSRMSIADLNGDGKYDYIIKQPGSSIDPAHDPDPNGTTYKIEAYLHDGTFLWRKDLGPAIEPGIWYSPMMIFDFNGDGKAEVAAKTGPVDSREANGRVISGPEWVSVFDGMTGEEIARADWPERSARYGDYNRTSRNQMGVAYLDGKTPFLLVARGTYKLMVVDAYQLKENKLELAWHWDGDEENPVIRSMGAHGMHSADVDEDGREEVILGSIVLDDNGTVLWSAGLGHPDKCFVTDVDPERPGLEIFYAIEPWREDGKGVCLVEAKSGKVIWDIGQKTWHVGNGMVADIDPSLPGLECFASEDSKGGSSDKYIYSAKGEKIGETEDVPDCTPWVFWDADLLRESYQTKRPDRSLTRERGWWRSWNPELMITKYKGDTISSGMHGRVILVADMVGDWREELICVENGRLKIYTTTIPARDRRVCLMQDPVYRIEVAHRAMGYEQAPVTSYYLGE